MRPRGVQVRGDEGAQQGQGPIASQCKRWLRLRLAGSSSASCLGKGAAKPPSPPPHPHPHPTHPPHPHPPTHTHTHTTTTTTTSPTRLSAPPKGPPPARRARRARSPRRRPPSAPPAWRATPPPAAAACAAPGGRGGSRSGGVHEQAARQAKTAASGRRGSGQLGQCGYSGSASTGWNRDVPHLLTLPPLCSLPLVRLAQQGWHVRADGGQQRVLALPEGLPVPHAGHQVRAVLCCAVQGPAAPRAGLSSPSRSCCMGWRLL